MSSGVRRLPSPDEHRVPFTVVGSDVLPVRIAVALTRQCACAVYAADVSRHRRG
jgi:hypothetical protein